MTFKYGDALVTMTEQKVTLTRLIKNRPYTIEKEVGEDDYKKVIRLIRNLINLEDSIFIKFCD